MKSRRQACDSSHTCACHCSNISPESFLETQLEIDYFDAVKHKKFRGAVNAQLVGQHQAMIERLGAVHHKNFEVFVKEYLALVEENKKLLAGPGLDSAEVAFADAKSHV